MRKEEGSVEEIPSELIKKRIEEERLEFLPVCDDVKAYFQALRGTQEYQKVIRERIRQAEEQLKAFSQSGRVDLEPPTYNEMATVFEEMEEFKQFFWDFYEDVVHLEYNPKNYSQQFREAFTEYKGAVRNLSVTTTTARTREEIEEKDLARSQCHDKAAGLLVKEEFVSNEFLGKIVIRAFLVDQGYDFIRSARQADLARIMRSLPDRFSQLKLLAEQEERSCFFSPQRARDIQDEFLKNYPGAREVKREDYFKAKKLYWRERERSF